VVLRGRGNGRLSKLHDTKKASHADGRRFGYRWFKAR